MRDVTLLKEALPYLRRHRRRTMVIKLGGEIAAKPRALRSLATEISLLAHVNIRIVVVHGGGPQATDLSRRLGLEPRLVQGRRITDAATLDVAKMVFGGSINLDILTALKAQGLQAVGLSGVDGSILEARRRPVTVVADEATGAEESVDFGHVGDVTGVDTALLSLLVEHGYVPVVASLASDAEGNLLNVNADTVAAAVARGLSAAKLISMTAVPGVLEDRDDPSSVISRLTVAQAREALASGRIAGGMVPKVRTIIQAVEGGVEAGHILSGLDENALLLELFTNSGVGTLIEAGEREAGA
ncbi:MAG: acetylglutamate kinase [Planctomycetota bacterium]